LGTRSRRNCTANSTVNTQQTAQTNARLRRTHTVETPKNVITPNPINGVLESIYRDPKASIPCQNETDPTTTICSVRTMIHGR